METENSVPCVGKCGADSANSNNNNNNINCNQSISITKNAIVIDDEESKTTSTLQSNDDVSMENCDNAVAVAFDEIHLNNNASIIGFADDEDDAVSGPPDDSNVSAAEDACCKPDAANNCGIDAAVEDGKYFRKYAFAQEKTCFVATRETFSSRSFVCANIHTNVTFRMQFNCSVCGEW